VTIFNIRGNEVVTLQEGELEQGRHSLQWNASNASGQKVPSGLYLYRVSSDSRTLTGKMLLLK
jgi:flagellar hook assembly protein FlgD